MKVRSKLAGILAASFLAVVPLGLGLPAATAATVSSCSMNIPSIVRISTPHQAVTARLSSDCAAAGAIDASWDVYHPTQGSGEVLWFLNTSTEIWNVYDGEITPAVYTWRPSGAFDSDEKLIDQNTPRTDVRVGSSAAIYTARTGSYVTIKTSSGRYAYSLSQWVRWGGTRGTIQYYRSAGWTNLKYAYQDASGYYTYRFYAPQSRSYRVIFPSAPTIWGSVSGSSYR